MGNMSAPRAEILQPDVGKGTGVGGAGVGLDVLGAHEVVSGAVDVGSAADLAAPAQVGVEGVSDEGEGVVGGGVEEAGVGGAQVASSSSSLFACLLGVKSRAQLPPRHHHGVVP